MGFWGGKGNRAGAAIAALLMLALCSAGRAFADDDHYNQVLVGERPAGMGGAYTAVSDDASGLYYNPAGTVYSSGSNMSVSLNSFSTYTKNYKSAIGTNDYLRRSTALTPNFFGVIQHTELGTLGFSFAVPESTLEEQDTTISNPLSGYNTFTINFNREITRYNFGPSWAKAISNDLSVGATLYIHYKKYKLSSNQYAQKTDLSSAWINITQKMEEFGFRPTLGAIWSPQGSKYAIGLSVEKTGVFSASRYYQSLNKTSSGTTATDPTFTAVNSSARMEYPLTAKFGIAYFPSSALLVAGDLSYHSSTNTWDDIYGIPNDHPAVVNAAVGCEMYLSSKFALRTGFYTDRSNRTSAYYYDKVDLYGLALSGTYFSKSSSVTFGLDYSTGSGQANISGSVQDLTMHNIMFFIGSSYGY